MFVVNECEDRRESGSARMDKCAKPTYLSNSTCRAGQAKTIEASMG